MKLGPWWPMNWDLNTSDFPPHIVTRISKQNVAGGKWAPFWAWHLILQVDSGLYNPGEWGVPFSDQMMHSPACASFIKLSLKTNWNVSYSSLSSPQWNNDNNSHLFIYSSLILYCWPDLVLGKYRKIKPVLPTNNNNKTTKYEQLTACWSPTPSLCRMVGKAASSKSSK